MNSETSSLTIACLPVSGSENPYQLLMIQGLNQHPCLKAFPGINDRFFGILRTVMVHRPDYLHFDWIVSFYYRRWMWLTYLSVILFCLQLKIVSRFYPTRLTWTLHNFLPHDLPQPAVHRFCQRFIARHCAWIRVFSKNSVSKAMEEFSLPESHFKVIPQGDYTAVYPNSTSLTEAREKLNLPKKATVFLFLGLIRPYKGILELIRAFKQLNKPNTYLILAGKTTSTTFEKQIREELTTTILFKNQFIPESALHYYFNASDAVVIPFIQVENSGSTVLAMGFSKPILAPAKGVLTERLAAQKELLFDRNTTLSEVMTKFFDSTSDEREKIGKANLAALKKYDWTNFSTAFL